MGVQQTQIQKANEIFVDSGSIDQDFLGCDRQFDWLEISLVYDKSDKCTAIQDSYNVELAANYIKSVNLENFIEIYSLKQNIQLIKLRKNIFCTKNLPLTDYIHNPIYQDLIDE